MSCPEIVRLALLNPNTMEFDEIETEEDTKIVIGSLIDTNNIKVSKMTTKFFWELRIFTIQILQNRNYKLWERLIILGLFYQKLEEYSDKDMNNEIPNVINIYTNYLETGIFHEMLGDIPSNNTLQMVLLKELTDKRLIKGVENKRYLQCFYDFIKGIEFYDEASKEEVGKKYEEACIKYYEPFMEQYEYILENYLVNNVFKNAFPVAGEKNVFGNYTMLIIHYAMIKMHLIGMSRLYKDEFTVEHVVKLIQSFAKVVEHNKVFLKNIYDLLKQNECTNMAYMSILIKN